MNRFSIIIAALLLNLIPCNAQDDPLVEFAVTSRLDLIGLKNHDNTKHALFHSEADISASMFTERMGLFSGGEFFVQAMGVYGKQASANITGDLQVFSNIESDSRLFLYQLYYKQTFKKFILKIGQIDMNSDYLVSAWAAPMINSSFGVMPTISLNMPVSIFAYLSPGISFKYLHSKQWSFQTAFFDGDPGDYDSNRYGMNWRLSKDEGWFNISEVHFKTRSDLYLGRYKAGIFYHSKSIPDSEGISGKGGNPGFFFIGDQQITFEKNTIKNGLSMFFQFSYTPLRQNMIERYTALGLIYRGMFPGWNEDEFTVAVASAQLGKDFREENAGYLKNETAIEITYKKYITPSIMIQPDFQYIINPGANMAYTGNVSTGLLRTIISF